MAQKEEKDPADLPPEGSGAQPPIRNSDLKVRKPKTSSAGLPGITTALGHARKYMAPGQALKTMGKLNQKGGIDCPGCAWPDPDDDRSSLGEYCENGIKAIAEEAQNRTIGAPFFAEHSIGQLRGMSDFELGKLGRIAEPMVLQEGAPHYAPIAWEEAFALIGRELRSLASPDEAIFYTSGRTSNEAAFMYQLFARAYGTNNLPDCSNMCHESSGVGLSQTIGIGKGTVKLPDLHEAEVIIVMGQNPGTNHPRMLTALERCKENGGQIITVNPLAEAGLQTFKNPQRPLKMLRGGTRLTDLHVPVRINGDVAFLKALMLQLWYAEKTMPGRVFDWDFIQAHTEGYEDFITHIQPLNFGDLVDASGAPREAVLKAAEMLRYKKKIIVCWAMGLTQHQNGVDNVREIVNLLLLKGSIGKAGAGACPVRGHSNVQGDRTMGIWEAPPPAFLDRLQQHFGFEPPRHHGFATVDAIRAMHQGRASVFVGLGGNFLSATPDTEFTAQALRRCRLTVHVSTKLNRSHLIHGKKALILPCLGRTEIDEQAAGPQFVSVENSMGIVHSSQGILPPCSDKLHSEPAIVAAIAKATLQDPSPVDWNAWVANYDLIRDAIAQTIPGFEDYNERVRRPAGFYLPNGPREARFPTDTGKAKFTINRLPAWELDETQFLMMTIRSHDQFNTTIYGLNDRYRGIYRERRVVLMNREDMEGAGLQQGQEVDLISQYEGTERVANRFLVVPYNIPRRCVATYFPEANVLVPIDAMDPRSKTPASKSVIIRIRPHT